MTSASEQPESDLRVGDGLRTSAGLQADASGVAHTDIGIPYGLNGSVIATQWFSLEPGLNSLHVASSNGGLTVAGI